MFSKTNWCSRNTSHILNCHLCDANELRQVAMVTPSCEGWLRNQGMQSIMQTNGQGGEGKGEPYSALPENYLPFSSICELDMNTFFNLKKYISTIRYHFKLDAPLHWTWHSYNH